MNEENTKAIFDILLEHAEKKPDSIDASTSLESIGVESLAMVEIIFDLEEHFDITIPDPREIEGLGSDFKTAGDVITAVSGLIEEKP